MSDSPTGVSRIWTRGHAVLPQEFTDGPAARGPACFLESSQHVFAIVSHAGLVDEGATWVNAHPVILTRGGAPRITQASETE